VHLAGTVEIGQGSWLDLGAIVNNSVAITSNSIIGSEAVNDLLT